MAELAAAETSSALRAISEGLTNLQLYSVSTEGNIIISLFLISNKVFQSSLANTNLLRSFLKTAVILARRVPGSLQNCIVAALVEFLLHVVDFQIN